MHRLPLPPALLVVVALILGGCSAASIADSPALLPAPPEPAGPRLTVLISDLHMGVGRQQQDPDRGTWTKGDWHPTEDFQWAAEFSLFMDEMIAWAKAAGAPADLVIAGDFLELWQAAGHKCGLPRKRNLGCTEAQALVRLERVLGAHEATFQAFRKFAAMPENRIILIPGNHDAALVFERVAARVVTEIGNHDGRVRVAAEGYWRSADGRLFVEHGHQMEGDMNKFPDKNRPAVCVDRRENRVDCNDPAGEAYLLRSSGENFVQAYYNRFEERFPVIDNLSKETLGVSRGINASSLAETTSAIVRGLKFLVLEQTLAQALQSLGEPEDPAAAGEPVWDYDAIQGQGTAFLVASLTPGTTLRQHAETLHRQGKLAAHTKLTRDEADRLCRLRDAQIKAGRMAADERCPLKTAAPPESLGAALTALFSDSETLRRNHLRQRCRALPENRANGRDCDQESGQDPQETGFQLYIYGHTHKAESPKSPFAAEAAWRPLIVNTGAWQRVATPEQLAAVEKKQAAAWGMEADDPDLFRRLRPHHLPPCYTFVAVPPYGTAESPNPLLVYWARNAGSGAWEQQASCPDLP